jgi:Na+/H+-dicarboxylate symporter
MLGLGLGLLVGLFFGELTAPLEVVGEAFIRLLQMTVLPYVVVSLMSGLGRLEIQVARRLGLWGGGLLLLLWALAFMMVALMPLAFPPLQSASFFSTSLVEPKQAVDFVGLYIPSNPFHSLANNAVPAVVIFSVALGVALITLPAKRQLIDSLEVLGDALLRINAFVTNLTPYGVFAIAASAAGTMSTEEFARVQVYLLSYVAFALVTTFGVLPGLVAALTPLPHGRLISRSKDALMTAFATGSSFVVIPMLAEEAKLLLREHALEGSDSESLVDVVVPASHSFPHTAKVLSLSFVVFAGWFADSPLRLADYPVLALAGIASIFGSVNVAIPFLLDLMKLPHDLFQLFVATSVINARFGALLQAMHVFALSLLVACALGGTLKLQPGRVLRYAATTLLVIGLTILGGRFVFAWSVDTTYHKDEVVNAMGLLREPVPAVVHRTPQPAPALDPERTRLDQILERGVIRVGYVKDNGVPFVYFNDAGELVGWEVELVHSLARSLDLTLEFVPLPESRFGAGFGADLESGACDIIVGQSVVSMKEIAQRAFSTPYFHLNVGFLVRDQQRQEFSEGDEVRARRGLRLAIPNDAYYIGRLGRMFPHADASTPCCSRPRSDPGGACCARSSESPCRSRRSSSCRSPSPCRTASRSGGQQSTAGWS